MEFVQSGMIVGLGAGTTAVFVLPRLAQLLRCGQLRDILGVPASMRTGEEAQRLGIPLTTLDEHPVVDLMIDGADEVDPALNLIKGGDGTLYHTDQGNLILDCDFGAITDPCELAAKLEGRAGIVEHGLFLGLATDIIVAGKEGLRHLERQERKMRSI